MNGGVDPTAVVFGALVGSAVERLEDLLRRSAPALDECERTTLVEAAREQVLSDLRSRLTRLVLLEMHGARITGGLRGDTAQRRWERFLEIAVEPPFRDHLARTYPTLGARVGRMVGNRVEAVVELGARLARDKGSLDRFIGDPRLLHVELGMSDPHDGGRAVAALRLAGGPVWYKPRAVDPDLTLARWVGELVRDDEIGLRVPDVLVGRGYGYTRHISHRHSSTEEEERGFYRAMGGWLAVMALLGGSDFHHENVIAHGSHAYLVDCEALFKPVQVIPSPYGGAVERANHVIERLVNTMLLPTRSAIDQHDFSALGHLPGQQPPATRTRVVGFGSDSARVVEEVSDDDRAGRNHPVARPRPDRFWSEVVEGYDILADRIDRLDRRGLLVASLRPFADIGLRVVLRSTEEYLRLERALWHPAGFHDEVRAIAKTRELLMVGAARDPRVPCDPEVIDGEVAALSVGDVPVFSHGRGEAGAGPPLREPVAAAVTSWRSRERDVDRRIIWAALPSAYRDKHHFIPAPPRTAVPRFEELGPRRIALLDGMVHRLVDSAVRGDDGTVTWIAATDLGVAPLSPDLYSGLAGIVVTLAAYSHATSKGAVQAVPGVDEVLRAARHALVVASEVHWTRSVGGYCGLGGLLWAWLTVHRCAGGDEAVDAAARVGRRVLELLGDAEEVDVVYGLAGAIVPLISLADLTGDDSFLGGAVSAAEMISARAVLTGAHAHWPSREFPGGVGGFAHGSTGIGWALARLGMRVADPSLVGLAEKAFAHESSLFSPRDGWEDLRFPEEKQHPVLWCHGSVGIGLAAADLSGRGCDLGQPSVLREATRITAARRNLGNHTLCHGHLGKWELLDREPDGTHPAMELRARVTTDLEDEGPRLFGPVEVPMPGMMDGVSGLIYQMLRMDAALALPSVLLLE